MKYDTRLGHDNATTANGIFFGQTKRYLHGPNSSISDTTAEVGTREQLDVKHGENKTNNTYIYDRHLVQTALVELERADKLEKLNLRDEGNWNLSTRKMTNIKLPQRCPQNLQWMKKIQSCFFPQISFSLLIQSVK